LKRLPLRRAKVNLTPASWLSLNVKTVPSGARRDIRRAATALTWASLLPSRQRRRDWRSPLIAGDEDAGDAGGGSTIGALAMLSATRRARRDDSNASPPIHKKHHK
jgi:hypothetical protein